jgi:glucose-6-phosphate dehydrogenase assembly protein OpcA
VETPLSVVTDVQEQLDELREHEAAAGAPSQRTSVMTHVVWAPRKWVDAAHRTLAGLEERHPSRTILLVPEPRQPAGIETTVSMRCFTMPGVSHDVCSEVIELRLGGKRAQAPGSIVEPLLIADLPTFVRWRGEPAWGSPELDQLVGVCDRLVLDSSEWRRPKVAYAELAGLFDRIAVSDIAWGRGRAWRGRLAERWPGIRKLRKLGVTGPRADALLLAGWLRSRLKREVELVHRPGKQLTRVAVDGEAVPPPLGLPATPSDLLSAELDNFGRDPIYEAAVRANVSP